MTKRTLFVFLILFGIWEIVFRTNPHLAYVLASPIQIGERLIHDWQVFSFHGWVTAREMMQGFLFALALALPLAILMDGFKSLRSLLQPLFVFIQCIPLFALAPIMVILFDWSEKAIVVTTGIMIFFPLTMALYHGLLSTPQSLIDYFKSRNASLTSLYWKLKLPWAMPHFISGLKVSAGIAGIGAVGGEWAGGQSGLGLLMLESRRGGDFEQSFAALFALVLITLSFYGLIAMLENGMFRRLIKRSEVLCLVIGAVMLAGCASQPETQERKLLLDWLPNPNHIPLYVGVEKGFFKEEGVPLKIRKVADPTDILPYVTSGQVDFVVHYVPDSIRAEMTGGVAPIATYVDQPLLSFMCLKELNITKVSDINGLTVGFCATGFGQNFLKQILKENGVGMVELVDVHYSLVPALATKKVDVLFGGYFNIEGEYLKSLGVDISTLPQTAFGIPDHPEFVIVAKKGFDAETAEHFRAGLQKSIRYAKAHPEEAFNIYLRYNPEKGEKTIAWERNSWETTRPLFADETAIDWEKWETFKEWLKKRGLV
jgi:NitT/TauT family transport system substrate-binding protein